MVTNDFPTRRGGIESFVLALCERLPPDEVVVYTASMPGDRGVRRRAAVPGPPRPVRRCCCPPRRSGDGSSAVLREARLRPGGLRCERAAGAARAPAAGGRGVRGWWRSPTATRCGGRGCRSPGGCCAGSATRVDVMTYVSEWCRDRIAPALSPAAAVADGAALAWCRHRAVLPRLRRSRRCVVGSASPRTAPVVVCTARMVPRKGQDTLIRAWPEVLAAAPGRGPAAGR